MSLDPISAALTIGKMAISRIWPDPQKQAEEERKLIEIAQRGDLAELEAEVKLMTGQLEINKIEASHKSMFVAGWRPAVGWCCVSILAFNYILLPLIDYLVTIVSFAVDSKNVMPLPEKLDMTELWPVLIGMLGLGGMRSFDKHKKTQTDKLG